MPASTETSANGAPALTARLLALPVPAMSPKTSCADAAQWLKDHPGYLAVPVADDQGKVLGLVNRLNFFMRYAQQYAPELFGNKSILRMANTEPLVVDENVPLAELSRRMIQERPEAIIDCFVVTGGGRYLGLGTGEALMRAKVDLLTSREEDLRIALSDAEKANRAKSEFLALMSHELRTPLNAILGFSEIIHSLSFGNDIHRYREYAGDIHRAGAHLLSLINDILDLSKAESGKFELHPEPAMIADIAEDAVALMRERALAASLELTFDLPLLPVLLLDRLRIKQIFLNLLSNAIKFTPQGGRVALNGGIRPHGAVWIAVSDTGIGIPPDMIPIALEAFRQVNSSRARNIEGTGLGLPLTKALVEMHGGSIAIESALQSGTIVTMEFPVSCRAPMP